MNRRLLDCVMRDPSTGVIPMIRVCLKLEAVNLCFLSRCSVKENKSISIYVPRTLLLPEFDVSVTRKDRLRMGLSDKAGVHILVNSILYEQLRPILRSGLLLIFTVRVGTTAEHLGFTLTRRDILSMYEFNVVP